MDSQTPDATFLQNNVEKRHKLFNRIVLLSSCMGIFYAIEDSFYGNKEAPFIDLFITLVLAVCYILNIQRYHNAARIIGLTFVNIIFAIYASVIPWEVGIYLFYFPLIAVSAAVFGYSEKRKRNFFIGLSVFLLAALFISDFNLVGTYTISTPSNVKHFFLINLFSSLLILIMCINFIINLNQKSEEGLYRLAKEVKQKNANLEKTNEELDRFLYSTSHDLRAPVLSIKGLIHIVHLESKDAAIQEYLSMMVERADNLDGFIKSIIDYTKNKQTKIVKEVVDFDQLLDEVKENLKSLDGFKHIRFEKEIRIRREIQTDKARLLIILTNLISNAIKYHNLEQSDPWINVSINLTDNLINIIVKDNGQGISLEKQQNIFDMFYRGTEQSKGSGLGLYIAKEMVERMNGTIRVESHPNQGTSFFINFPVFLNDIE